MPSQWYPKGFREERLSYADAQEVLLAKKIGSGAEASLKEARELREKHHCQVVLALTHQFAPDDCALAKAAGKDIDLILGGHDHFTDLRSDCGHATYLKADSDLKTQWVMTMLLSDSGQSEPLGRWCEVSREAPRGLSRASCSR